MNNFKTTFGSFAQMLEMLPNDKTCREFLERVRWNGVPVCPNCGIIDANHYELKTKGEFTGTLNYIIAEIIKIITLSNKIIIYFYAKNQILFPDGWLTFFIQ